MTATEWRLGNCASPFWKGESLFEQILPGGRKARDTIKALGLPRDCLEIVRKRVPRSCFPRQSPGLLLGASCCGRAGHHAAAILSGGRTCRVSAPLGCFLRLRSPLRQGSCPSSAGGEPRWGRCRRWVRAVPAPSRSCNCKWQRSCAMWGRGGGYRNQW